MAFTLIRRGELRAPNGDAELQRELNKHIPVEYIVNWFRGHEGRSGIENRLLIVQSGTASGKSTTIPPEIFNALVRTRYANGGGIICTQPRVLTAIANAKQIVGIPKYGEFLKIGEAIGWSTQYSKLKPRRIGLLSATIGILTMQLQVFSDAEIANLYRFILIDEAHERSLGADVTFAALKGFLKRNAHLPNCPFVVLMSATIDVAKFARYFLGAERTLDELVNNIIICNAAPSQKRDIMWPSAPITNIIDESARIVEHILDTAPAPRETWDPAVPVSDESMSKQTERDDILIFVPGIAEINAMKQKLKDMNARRVGNKQTCVAIVPLNSQTISENRREYQQTDLPLRSVSSSYSVYPERRVIISTNVAETGKTFNTLRYVLDMGFSRENEFNPNLKVEVLISKPAPVSRIMQRHGRVGRKFPGIVYPLYTEETFKKLQPDQFPEIITSNISPIILQIVFEQQKTKFMNATRDQAPYFRVSDIDMLDPPQPDILLDGLERAYALGFIAHAPPVFNADFETFLAPNIPESLHQEAQRANITDVGITKLGRLAIELTAVVDSLEGIRAILAGFAWGYRVSDLIAMVTFSKLSAVRDDEEQSDVHTKKKRSEIIVNTAYADVFANNEDALEVMMRWHTILGDTFFDGIAVDASLMRVFQESARSQPGSISLRQKLARWCERMNIDFTSALSFIETKDTIISALMALGFDVYRGVSIIEQFNRRETPDGARASALSDAIVRYKRCIYDGYRLNAVLFDADDNSYHTYTGLHVASGFIEGKFNIDAPSRPRALVFDKFRGVANLQSTYDIIGNQITILDGFIGADILFTQ